MRKTLFLFLVLIGLLACQKQDKENPNPKPQLEFLSAVDISAYPEIALAKPIFYNATGVQQDFLEILKESGVNAVRLKLWVDPASQHASFTEVKSFSETLKSHGFKIWLTVHYSDT